MIAHSSAVIGAALFLAAYTVAAYSDRRITSPAVGYALVVLVVVALGAPVAMGIGALVTNAALFAGAFALGRNAHVRRENTVLLQERADLAEQARAEEARHALAAELTEAGLPVHVQVQGVAHQVPAALDLTGYRVMQEALTNVVGHAGPGIVVIGRPAPGCGSCRARRAGIWHNRALRATIGRTSQYRVRSATIRLVRERDAGEVHIIVDEVDTTAAASANGTDSSTSNPGRKPHAALPARTVTAAQTGQVAPGCAGKQGIHSFG